MRFLIAPLLFLFVTLVAPVVSFAQVVDISINLAPPPLPVYAQPPAPAPTYIWEPGYWAYSSWGYFWIPGTWVVAPAVGLLWTPSYWEWNNGNYEYHEGYWGPHVGFYGGINYGYGYGGSGFNGGGWQNGAFVNGPVTYSAPHNAASFNGGPDGTRAVPSPAEQAAAQEEHIPPTPEQKSHAAAASQNRALLASVNHGKPTIAATVKPGVFTGGGVVAAKRAGGGVPKHHIAATTPGLQPKAPPSAPRAEEDEKPANAPVHVQPKSQENTESVKVPAQVQSTPNELRDEEKRESTKSYLHAVAKPNEPRATPEDKKPEEGQTAAKPKPEEPKDESHDEEHKEP